MLILMLSDPRGPTHVVMVVLCFWLVMVSFRLWVLADRTNATCDQPLNPQSQSDCDKALAIEPKFVRALERRGSCYLMLKEPIKAMKDFESGLKLDPQNAGCMEGMRKCQASMYGGQRDEQTIANSMKDPEIQQILNDPVINNVLRDLQNNPAAGQQALKDPVIAERIQKLAAAGILSFA